MEQEDIQARREAIACGYDPVHKIGKGTYGLVYQVADHSGGTYAFKKIITDKSNRFGVSALNEIDILSRINHPYIIHAKQIIVSLTHTSSISILLPLADRSLDDIAGDIRYTTSQKLPILFKLATALVFLHQQGILHLDIKPGNCVIQGLVDPHPYLIDFDSTIVVEDIKRGRTLPFTAVTPEYRPPEIFSGDRQYTEATDVWSFGMTMLRVISGKQIFSTTDIFTTASNELPLKIITELFTDSVHISKHLEGVDSRYKENCTDLLIKCLQLDKSKRITSSEIVSHPLFQEYRSDVNGVNVASGSVSIPRIIGKYRSTHRDILKIIIHWCQTHFPQETAEVMFLAVDLYNRVGSHYIKADDATLMNVAAVCLHMALKLVTFNFVSIADYVTRCQAITPLIDKTVFPRLEMEIIQHLEGILNVNHLYRKCPTGYHLKHSFTRVVLAHDTQLYSMVDIDAWINGLTSCSTTPEAKTIPKELTISQLINL
jgi:serine/threonine protein kinase